MLFLDRGIVRKFLVIMDNSPEFLNALHYAATRAAKTGGGVEVLAIITPQDQTHTGLALPKK